MTFKHICTCPSRSETLSLQPVLTGIVYFVNYTSGSTLDSQKNQVSVQFSVLQQLITCSHVHCARQISTQN